MKKIFISLVTVCIAVLLVGCSSSDILKGTWSGEDDFYGEVTFAFDGNGTVTYSTNMVDNIKGTYTIDSDTKVTIKLESWSNEKVYNYTIKNNVLELSADDIYSPSYSNLLKK